MIDPRIYDVEVSRSHRSAMYADSHLLIFCSPPASPSFRRDGFHGLRGSGLQLADWTRKSGCTHNIVSEQGPILPLRFRRAADRTRSITCTYQCTLLTMNLCNDFPVRAEDPFKSSPARSSQCDCRIHSIRLESHKIWHRRTLRTFFQRG
jgi:hypothetical protein